MLDIKRIKTNKQDVENALRKRMPECSLDEIIELDNERLLLQRKLEELQSVKNSKSKEIATLKNQNKDVCKLILEM